MIGYSGPGHTQLAQAKARLVLYTDEDPDANREGRPATKYNHTTVFRYIY